VYSREKCCRFFQNIGINLKSTWHNIAEGYVIQDYITFQDLDMMVRKLQNEEVHNFYSSPSVIRMMKSRRIRWAGHVARMGAKRNTHMILIGKLGGGDH
jgi:hypothetical protein